MGIHLHRGGIAIAVFFASGIFIEHHVFRTELRIRFFGLVHGVHVFGIGLALIGVGKINGQTKVSDDIAAQVGEGVLIGDMITQRLDMLASIFQHMLAPVLHHMLGTGW